MKRIGWLFSTVVIAALSGYSDGDAITQPVEG